MRVTCGEITHITRCCIAKEEAKGYWWADHLELKNMVEYLFETGAKQEDILYALSKPWKWTPEYEAGWKVAE